MTKTANFVRNIFFSALFASTVIVSAHSAETTEDPVVAVVNGVELHKKDLEIIHKNLQEPWSQYDFESLFPTLQDLAIRLQLAEQDSLSKKLDESEDYKMNLQFVKANILQDLALKSYITEQMNEDNLRAYYDEKMQDFTPEEERKTRHILVETADKANEIIKRLDDGEDFSALAIEASIGPSGTNGGELGWASKNEFVPEFADAAWQLDQGSYSKAPVQTSYGFHVILVEDIRKTEIPQFEDVKALLEGELQRDLEEQFFEELQSKAEIERYDIHGEAIVIPDAPEEMEPIEDGDIVEVTEEVTTEEPETIEEVETQAEEVQKIADEMKEAEIEAIKEVTEDVSNSAEAGDAAVVKGQ